MKTFAGVAAGHGPARKSLSARVRWAHVLSLSLNGRRIQRVQRRVPTRVHRAQHVHSRHPGLRGESLDIARTTLPSAGQGLERWNERRADQTLRRPDHRGRRSGSLRTNFKSDTRLQGLCDYQTRDNRPAPAIRERSSVRWRFRQHSDVGQTRLVEEFAAAFARPTEFEALRRIIAGRFLELARCESVLFCEFQQAEAGYVVTSVAGRALTSPPPVLPSRGHVVQWLQVNEETLRLPDDRGAHEYLEPDERALLTNLGVRACLPLLSISRLAGILLLVSTKPSWQLRRGDLELLLACGRQAGLACETVGRHGEELARVNSLQQAQRLAVAGQLAAAVAHEIRNPLTAIRSTMQFALTSERPWEQKKQLLQEIVAEVDRIEKTVSSVLSLARPAQLEVADLDLGGIVEEAILLVEPYGDGRGVTMVRRLFDRPLIVQGDPRELRIVFVNILMNACQATESGGTVTIHSDKLTLTDALGHQAPSAEIDITDTGSGMTAEMRDKAFEPFVTSKKTGTGLGLSICLDIVSRHAGQIRLTSEVGRGTTVAVRIPLRGSA